MVGRLKSKYIRKSTVVWHANMKSFLARRVIHFSCVFSWQNYISFNFRKVCLPHGLALRIAPLHLTSQTHICTIWIANDDNDNDDDVDDIELVSPKYFNFELMSSNWNPNEKYGRAIKGTLCIRCIEGSALSRPHCSQRWMNTSNFLQI